MSLHTTMYSPPQRAKTYMPPATSELPRSAAPAIALYQLRLKRVNGSTATKRFASTRFIEMPERQANGRYTIEKARWKNAFFVERRERNASARCTMVFRLAPFFLAGRAGTCASGAATGPSVLAGRLTWPSIRAVEESGAVLTR